MNDEPFFRAVADNGMTLRRARQLLGLARDADARNIRRAYADALRALDVDADPQGFADLRDARDLALAEARRRAEEAPAGPGVAAADCGDDAASPAPQDPVAPSPPRDVREATPAATDPAAIEAHARAFAALLAPEDGLRVPLSGAEQTAAHAHLDALLADPRLDHVETRPAAEAWIADLLLAAGSRADPVVPRIVDAFGWAAQHGLLDQSPAEAAAVERAALLAELAAGPRFEPVPDDAREVYGGATRDLSDRASARWWSASRPLPDAVPAAASPPRSASPDPDPDPALGVEADAALAEHARAFAALLAPEGEAAETLAPAETQDAHAHLDALLADPRLDRLDFREGAGAWYAELAAAAGARADRVLPRLAAFFGWERDRGRFDQPPAQAWALDRLDTLAAWAEEDRGTAEYREELEDPSHYYHRAWLDLTRPRGWHGLLPRAFPHTTNQLLAMLREDQPRLHAEVAGHSRAAGRIWGVVVVIGFLACASVLGRMIDEILPDVPAAVSPPALVSGAPSPVADVLTTPDRDIEPVLVGVGGGALNIPAIAAANPRWSLHLTQLWADARRAGTPLSTFRADLFKQLATQYRAALHRAPYDQVARVRRLERDQFVFARDRFGTLACGDLVSGEPVPAAINRRFGEGRQALAGKVLLTMRGVPEAPTAKRFSIPIGLYRAAARRADLSPDAFGRALDRHGTSEAACAAWIALYDEALAAPRATGLKLLREM